ncbi:hypothetical protein KP509_38G051500 [Ceratopteris richardii]|uniref:N-acetyltransferase domain-containing protein n=1 Tax=Ceratopteris richardii TaxID=49495 RepID=A0A8T2Q3T8_CERRI|nr:hypothetical protein KP509_38G051500 [Ceratopteris richardii]
MDEEEKDIRELKIGSSVKGRNTDVHAVLQQIVKLERHIFPKHESLADAMDLELKKKNSGLLFAVACQSHENVEREASLSVAGYVIYSFTSSLAASIVKLAVRQCYRKQGYGWSLMKAAISKCRARSVCRVTLHVDPTREAAMGLYKKLGFQLDTVVHDYYAPQRDAYRMFIDFEPS